MRIMVQKLLFGFVCLDDARRKKKKKKKFGPSTSPVPPTATSRDTVLQSLSSAIFQHWLSVTGGFLQDKWAISYIHGSYWWCGEVLLRSLVVLGDFKRCLDNVVLVALYHLRFMLVLCVLVQVGVCHYIRPA